MTTSPVIGPLGRAGEAEWRRLRKACLALYETACRRLRVSAFGAGNPPVNCMTFRLPPCSK